MELSSRRLSEKMKEVITIENTEMPVREYNGQRVVTFKDIDTVHGNKTDTSKRNFNRNKKHFIDGEDFVVATRENLKRDNLSLLKDLGKLADSYLDRLEELDRSYFGR